MVVTLWDKTLDQLSAQSGGNRNRFSTSQDSTVSTINANSDLDWANQFNQGLVAVETSRPPTGHQRRRGWFDHDSSSPDRASSAARAQQNDQNLSRSHSDRVMESRSVHWPERDSELEVPSTANTRRSVRSMSRLALIHRKRKAVAPQVDDPMVKRRMPVQRPPDMDDLAWKRLLEELYPDKKYLDYAKAY
nr:hypothetical protein BaRGS_022042 [Batillaria attramentaria]